MRFLANENFPADAVTALRAAGHEISWVRSQSPGISDAEVLAWAIRESLVLLTFDKDFGELAWRHRLPASCGVVLFRIPMPSPATAGFHLAARICEREDWAGHFSVIETTRVRMRPLPNG